MAAILGRSDTRLVDRVHSERESGNSRDAVGGSVMGAPGGAAVVDYIRLRDPWCCADFADSIRDAQAFLEIRFGVGSRTRIQQQYRGLTIRLQHALFGWANQKAVGARQ
jgi:hypothetical protein